MLQSFINLSIISLVFFTILLLGMRKFWIRYKETTKKIQWGYGTFNKFKYQWRSHNMTHMGISSLPYEDRSTDSKFYSDIIQFDGKGMVLGYFDYLKAIIFARFYKFKSPTVNNNNYVGDW